MADMRDADMRDRERDPAIPVTKDENRADDSTRRPSNDPVGSTDPRDSASRGRGAFDFRRKDGEDESIADLVRRLGDQGSHLAQRQAELVQAEVRSSVNDLKEAAGAMAGAGVVGIAGLGVLLMGLSYLLGEVMDQWLATLIVAVATLAGAYAMFKAGQKKLQSSSFSVDRTRRTLERAPGAISGHQNHEGLNNGR